MTDYHPLTAQIAAIGDLLQGPYRSSQYSRVLLPLTVLRRIDCMLETTTDDTNILFHNTSGLRLGTLTNARGTTTLNHLQTYINGFPPLVRDLFNQHFNFPIEIQILWEADILDLIVGQFARLNLHPSVVTTIAMGLLFEDLLQRFNRADITNGDYYTPREVVQLMVELVVDCDDSRLPSGTPITMLDPTCGTGGMLAEARRRLCDLKRHADFQTYGQDFNPRAYAVAYADMLIHDTEGAIRLGDSLINDQFAGHQFDYVLANPPYGVDWKRQHKVVTQEHQKGGPNNRFPGGLPRISDGALLFVQHCVSKFKPYTPGSPTETGSRCAIVVNGSPLFTGGAGSGESEIRRWLIENDLLETIIALPEKIFVNTGIGTYIWIITNRKHQDRRHVVQLIDARDRWQPLRRSHGEKRRMLDPTDIAQVVQTYRAFREADSKTSHVLDSYTFGYDRVTVEEPLRLAYQMDSNRKSRFLDAAPHFLQDVQAIDRVFGRDSCLDWNRIREYLDTKTTCRWKESDKKFFRDICTERHADGERVIRKTRPQQPTDDRAWGWFPGTDGRDYCYEADSHRRDHETIPARSFHCAEENQHG